jgi:selenium metabolism protein YedF
MTASSETYPLSVLLVASEYVGRGEHDELGRILTRNFFHTLSELEPIPEVILFLNSGVKLVIDDSLILADLLKLQGRGVKMLACGTCLDFYGIKARMAVGEVSNMVTIANTMMKAAKVVSV